ncbi:uncharacterized protein LOC131594577 [Vicia villosa]|uniref:uncharacterized protein LOC131594577 n=1 Tax=Vicia villosa TaxID=3911 RepID=UPI00273B22D7|nr:uncharacterized protein LOC131594577 [Vicia villosa]XP_058722731.1 uncharacterized protein LOC131594577 [Vicia villosa]XP_058722732.1 uncharacterized protein LOC131594577 [Vicia villosa]XP_058722733.1 uncharacterized protein LOC131594577 [Vicia villosa]
MKSTYETSFHEESVVEQIPAIDGDLQVRKLSPTVKHKETHLSFSKASTSCEEITSPVSVTIPRAKHFSNFLDFHKIVGFMIPPKPPDPSKSLAITPVSKTLIHLPPFPSLEMVAARPLVTVQALDSDIATNSPTTLPIPDIMRASICPYIFNLVHSNISNNTHQPYTVSRKTPISSSSSPQTSPNLAAEEPEPKKVKMSTITSDDEQQCTTAEGTKIRYKFRKVAIFFAYCGIGYQGMQKRTGTKTIEGELEKALFVSGVVPKQKTRWILLKKRMVEAYLSCSSASGISYYCSDLQPTKSLDVFLLKFCCHDQNGLLHDVTAVLYELELSIIIVKVSTATDDTEIYFYPSLILKKKKSLLPSHKISSNLASISTDVSLITSMIEPHVKDWGFMKILVFTKLTFLLRFVFKKLNLNFANLPLTNTIIFDHGLHHSKLTVVGIFQTRFSIVALHLFAKMPSSVLQSHGNKLFSLYYEHQDKLVISSYKVQFYMYFTNLLLTATLVFDPGPRQLTQGRFVVGVTLIDAMLYIIVTCISRNYNGWEDTISIGLRHPSCTYVACSFSNKTICIYDFMTGEMVAKSTGHAEIVTGVIFLPDCKHIISVDGDGCVFVWKLSTLLSSKILEKIMEKGNPMPSRIPSQPHACSHISSCKEESQHCKINSMDVSSLKKKRKSSNGVLNSKSIHGEALSFKYNILRLPKWAQAKVAHCNEVSNTSSKAYFALFCLRLTKKFSVAWWVFSFPLTVLATASAQYAHEVNGIMAIVMMLILALISVLVCLALIIISALNIRVPLNAHKHISKQTNNIAAILTISLFSS